MTPTPDPAAAPAADPPSDPSAVPAADPPSGTSAADRSAGESSSASAVEPSAPASPASAGDPSEVAATESPAGESPAEPPSAEPPSAAAAESSEVPTAEPPSGAAVSRSKGSAARRSAARGGRQGRGRLGGWVVMAVLLVGALVVGVTDDGGPRTTGERARDLAASVACPTCDGQSVADSDSSSARNVRSFIEERIADGSEDDQIRGELAARYGDQILLTPGRSGLAGLVWVLPVAALVAALVGVALAFRRWRGRGIVHASDADRALVDEARAGVGPGVG